MAKKRNKKKNVLKVDFTNVEPGGKVPEGDYPVVVKEITVEESQNGNPYLKWVFSVADGRHKGKQLYHNTSLQPQALFNLRNTLEALGMEVPQKAIQLDLDNLIGLKAAVAVEVEQYQGKERSRVVEVFPLEELIEDDEELEDDDELEDEEYEDEDEEYEDEEEEEYEDEDDEDEELEDEDEEEDDEEEEEEYELFTKEELQEMDDDELLEIAEDFEVEPVYTGKGKKKKLSRAKTIKAILAAQEEE